MGQPNRSHITKKVTDSPSLSSCQMPITFQLLVGFHAYTYSGILTDYCLHRPYRMLSQYLTEFIRVSALLCLKSAASLMLSTIFGSYGPFALYSTKNPEVCREGCVTGTLKHHPVTSFHPIRRGKSCRVCCRLWLPWLFRNLISQIPAISIIASEGSEPPACLESPRRCLTLCKRYP